MVKPKKNKLKGGANIRINDEVLDEILQKNNLEMYIEMQIISDDLTVRCDTVQDLKEFN